MGVTLAKTAGFCFGVKRAVDLVMETMEAEEKKGSSRKKIYIYGDIVHNETVIKRFEDMGIVTVHTREDLEMVADSIVIIRAHGVGRDIYELLKANGNETVDASCPYVRKIQRLISEHSELGEKCCIVGNPDHPEIIGIVGWAHNDVMVIPDVEAAKSMPESDGEKLYMVAQTTFNIDKYKVIVDILEKKGYYVTVINTICKATYERQTEARELSEVSDAMIVIGGSSSSNTQKLFEICKSRCNNTRLIQTVSDLQFTNFDEHCNVGITAGASTPNEIIEEVLTYVRNEF